MSSPPTRADVTLRASDLTFAHPGAGGDRAFRLRVDALEVRAGEVLALCGASGSGKSTLLAVLAGQLRPDTGRLTIETDGGPFDPYDCSPAEWRRQRRHVGFVHQDPRDQLNDRRDVGEIVADPLHIHRLPGLPAGPGATPGGRIAAGLARSLGLRGRRLRRERRDRAIAMLRRVGIGREEAGRSPALLSGGQRQRVAIARALVAGPRLVFLDEPTSALDASVQASLIELIRELRRGDDRTAYVLVTHDLPLARQLADRVAILDRGQVVELGDVDRVFRAPASPTTRLLLGTARDLLRDVGPGDRPEGFDAAIGVDAPGAGPGDRPPQAPDSPPGGS